MKQTSDHANGDKAAGTGYKTLTPKPTSATPPLGNGASGSSQDHSRGKQGNGK